MADDGTGGSALPLILIELVLVLGGVLGFGVWQLRSVKRDRERMLAERAREAARRAEADATAPRDDGTPPRG